MAAGTCAVYRYEVLRLGSFCMRRSAGWGREGPSCEITVIIASGTGGSRDPGGTARWMRTVPDAVLGKLGGSR